MDVEVCFFATEVVVQTVSLTVGPEKSSAKLQNLSVTQLQLMCLRVTAGRSMPKVGTVVQVLEVMHRPDPWASGMHFLPAPVLSEDKA